VLKSIVCCQVVFLAIFILFILAALVIIASYELSFPHRGVSHVRYQCAAGIWCWATFRFDDAIHVWHDLIMTHVAS